MKRILLLLLIFVSAKVFAGGPGKGSLTIYPGNAISKVEISYNISQLMGEPTINGSFRWYSDSVDLLKYDTVIWLKVSNSMGSAFIKIDPAIPKKGQWAYNVTGSPRWDSVLVLKWNGNKGIRYMDAATAKSFWKKGFSVTGAQLSREYH